MLPKKFRLTFFGFQQNPQKYQRFFQPLFTVLVKNSLQKFPRFLVLVPKYLDKRSSLRHQTKRIIIEAIRQKLPMIKKGVDVLLKAKRILDKKERLLVEEEISKIFEEIEKIEKNKEKD